MSAGTEISNRYERRNLHLPAKDGFSGKLAFHPTATRRSHQPLKRDGKPKQRTVAFDRKRDG